ncbi:MarR family winged helix-turn-helix transcriptional regulator [Actinomadura sp. ATCC 31491]|uniref:MarR family winged helix-turn-helix transcriptional regulator n=1 Tax=Actinomadura luzonensis TaxID=2805427 RepID=A0ABT0G219_9ACTN|nr:MarR family winged helix-turn-helix transcriptional regulator [Actinomadura luzonensis]MCK2218146.1 MarR family winged helix-turn-helix transcriptional regulator [Actinomadura luzonensis]
MAEEATELPLLLAMAFRVLSTRLRERLADEGHDGLRPAHGFALAYLRRRGGSTAGELARLVGMTKQASAQLLAELESGGYVERRPNPDDRRSQIVMPTERGAGVERLFSALWREVEDDWARQVGAETLDHTRQALQALVRGSVPQGPAPVRPDW